MGINHLSNDRRIINFVFFRGCVSVNYVRINALALSCGSEKSRQH